MSKKTFQTMETPEIKLDRFPLSIQSFEDLRKRNYIYVDKTDYLYRFVNQGKSFFLATLFKTLLEETQRFNNYSGVRIRDAANDLKKNVAVHEFSHDTDWMTNGFYLNQPAYTTQYVPLRMKIKRLRGKLDEEYYSYIRDPSERRARVNSLLTDMYSQGHDPNSLIDRLRYGINNYNKDYQIQQLMDVYGIPRLLYYSGKVYDKGGKL